MASRTPPPPPAEWIVGPPSRRRHIHPQLEQLYAANQVMTPKSNSHEEQVTGIAFSSPENNWIIQSSQGSMADATWLDQATPYLEDLCQTTVKSLQESSKCRKRQLALPEMVFEAAGISLEFRNTSSLPFRTLKLTWNAMDFLREWSEAHQGISMPNNDSSEGGAGQPYCADSEVSSSRGVQILKTKDAALWKARTAASESSNDQAPKISSTTFHYDWTFSSPYVGRVVLDDGEDSDTGDGWVALSESAMPIHKLTDTSQPILYFDQIVLLEDDLHDHGQVQANAKIRVMPNGIYVLYQLIVRIDFMLIRLREARWFVEFHQDLEKEASVIPFRIYRDISWRECAWSELPKHNLPSQVKDWTYTEAWQQQQQQQSSSTQAAEAAWNALLQRIPLVSEDQTPSDLPRYSVWNPLESSQAHR